MANVTLWDILTKNNLSQQVIVPTQINELLSALFIDPPIGDVPTMTPGNPIIGKVKIGSDKTLLGFASLNLSPLGPAADYSLSADPDQGFTIDIQYNNAFTLPATLLGAQVVVNGDKKHLEAVNPGQVRLKNLIVLRITGSAAATATLRLLFPGASDEVVTLLCEPDAFLWGSSGFGLHLPGGIVVDDSMTKAPPQPVGVDNAFASSNVAWRGIAIRGAELYLPENTPLIGGTPIPVDLEIASPAGIDARTKVTIPATLSRPELDVTVEWHDPTATSLAMALPTSIEIVAKWQAKGGDSTYNGAPITFGGGDPLIVRARFVHDLRDGKMKFTLSAEGGGDEGLVSLKTVSGEIVPNIFVTAVALATAIVADSQVNDDPNRDASGTTLHELLVVATGLSSILTDHGSVVVHGVEIDGDIAIADGPLRFRVDYSVDVVVKTIGIGVLSVSMNPDVPMRIRYRNVLLVVNFNVPATEKFSLSWQGCSVGVEDPGGWLIHSPGSLLDIIGTRSGHGSQWFEIDLRFAIDLGPVKVSGATLRASLPVGGNDFDIELRGLGVSLALPGLVEGSGFAQITDTGFFAAIGAKVVPLGVGASASLEYGGGDLLVITIGLDLPAPLPLANSGLGLFGILGVFGINGRIPEPPAGADPVEYQLGWKPWKPNALAPQPGGLVLGLGAVVGTLPDLAFSFSSKALLVVGTPDLSVRASLDAKFISPHYSMANLDDPTQGDFGLRVIGLLVIDETAVTLALRGTFDIPVLLHVLIPVSAFYPYGKSNWYLRIGSDGVDGRGPGPMQARLLPDLIDINGYAFLMFDGEGLNNFAGTGMNLRGFSIGLGFGFDLMIPMGIVFLEMSAHAAIGLGTDPLMLIGQGGLSGSLHLGPFSLGISADVDFQIGPGDVRNWHLDVCGEIDLWFTTLRGCVEIGSISESDEVPDPGDTILKGVSLIDWNGRELTSLEATNAGAGGGPPASLKIVWPDAILALEFAVGPQHMLNTGISEHIIKAPFTGTGLSGTEKLMYTYALSALTLSEWDIHTQTWIDADLSAWPASGAWQLPRHGSPTDPSLGGARELALLTGEAHLWTRNLLDGGVGLPGDPLAALADPCTQEYTPEPGWALGIDAIRRGDAHWELPSEGSRLAPLYSYFTVDVDVRYREHALSQWLAQVESFFPPLNATGIARLSKVINVGDRGFSGSLALPYMVLPGGGNHGLGSAEALLTFSELLTTPFLYLLVPDSADPGSSVQGEAIDAALHVVASLVLKDIQSLGDGRALLVFVPDSSGQVAGIRFRYFAATRVEIFGVSAITVTASNSADAATKAAHDSGNKQTAVSNKKPGEGKPLLKVGTSYKLSVTVSRSGQRQGGSIKALSDQSADFYFRTAPLPVAFANYATINKVALLKTQDNFDPSYLERYLSGWTPIDHFQQWFLDDPVAVHFNVDHIAALAALYGHDVKLWARRTDTPAAAPDSGVLFDITHMVRLQAGYIANSADQRVMAINEQLAAIGAPCRLPEAGASVVGQPLLAPNAQYDLSLLFPKAGEEEGGHFIPGIIFSTSRFRGPVDMLRALGFESQGGMELLHLTGDVPVRAAVVSGSAVADRALEEALISLGLTAWSPARASRSSGLWTQVGQDWKLTGVLLESPEAICRPAPGANWDRVAVDTLRCGGHSFEIMRRNSAGSRILFLTANPFTPAASLELTVREVPPLLPGASAPVPQVITARCQVGILPAYLEELQ